MKISFPFTVAILVLLLLPISTAASAGAPAANIPAEPYDGLPLCQPEPYPSGSQDCLALGPSGVISDLARKGISYPFRPLPAHSPDPALNQVNAHYAKINIDYNETTGMYSSLEDARTNNNPVQTLQGRLLYVSYTQSADIEGAHFVYTTNDTWMRASPLEYPTFQGLEFDRNPSNPFGWIVEDVKPRRLPSYNEPELDKTYSRETVVQVYGSQVDANRNTWYMIGLDEWVERRYIRQIKANPTPPAGVTNNRWLEVNLYEQILSVYENGQLRFATLIASGIKPFYTRPGLFQIRQKKPFETMSGTFEADRSDYYYLEDVPWTMYFDEERALHGAYWRAMFGYPQSHGCVNLSTGDSRWIYDWAKEGDWVYVWDPSGETPTDPSQYTKGGA